MFSGIVEKMAQVVKIETEQTNKHFTLRNPFGEALSIDQSIAHNGVCLTVVKIEGDLYTRPRQHTLETLKKVIGLM